MEKTMSKLNEKIIGELRIRLLGEAISKYGNGQVISSADRESTIHAIMCCQFMYDWLLMVDLDDSTEWYYSTQEGIKQLMNL